jgi:16S rRNA (cytidine1402-2'-O)-methyltransferase
MPPGVRRFRGSGRSPPVPNVLPSSSQAPVAAQATGTLYVVSTPIGNLADVTHRALAVLGEVEAILCEDTRHSRTLLTRYGIATPVESLHEHNEASAIPRVLRRLLSGGRLALISDAGTPTVSDPGARLVAAAIADGVSVVPIPGPSALLAALSASGLGGGPFTFFGFLDRKGEGRRRQLASLSSLEHPGVLYEAPSRVGTTLQDLVEAGCGGRRAVVARELTKQYEEFRRGTVAELAEYYRDEPPRGEVVVIVDGRAGEAVEHDPEALRQSVATLRAEGVGARDIARALVERFGIARNEAYRMAHEDA